MSESNADALAKAVGGAHGEAHRLQSFGAMMRSLSTRTVLGALLVPFWLAVSTCHAAAEKGLADMSLEELSTVIVTSVSRQDERLSDAAASIYVISAEDIRRSGARSLAEVLRLAPNLQVARTSASTYAISARGVNNALGNKLLVLIDGRTVYTPLFSGVFWDQQDVILEDVARIEVISGPGATLWGANAVNGVINVITHTASSTQGILVSGGVGTRDRLGSIRYGGQIGEATHYRVYGRDLELQNTRRENGSSAPDGWRRKQSGFRVDWGEAARSFTFQGDAYSGNGETRPIGGPVEVSGMNLLARWKQQFSSGSDIRVQAYYDRNERVDRTAFQGKVSTFDIEFQHGVPLGNHRILWGAGYRNAHDDIESTLPSLRIAFVPPSRTLTWQNVFVQDSWRLRKDVELTLGVKAESNDYTGWEYLPSARLAWKPADNQLLWGSASRAVRAPARLDRDFSLALVAGAVTVPIIRGGPYFESEVAKVFEIGYRAQPTSVFSYSVTAFRHNYDKLRSGMPPPAFIENQIEGFANGVEAWGTLQAARNWRLIAGYSTLRQHLGVKPGSRDPTGPIALGNDPDHQWLLRSSLTLSGGHEFDVMVRRIGSLPLQTPGVMVPAYTAVDARWGWRLNRNVEVALTLQNLLDPAHAEFGQPGTRSEYRRSAFINLLLRH